MGGGSRVAVGEMNGCDDSPCPRSDGAAVLACRAHAGWCGRGSGSNKSRGVISASDAALALACRAGCSGGSLPFVVIRSDEALALLSRGVVAMQWIRGDH